MLFSLLYNILSGSQAVAAGHGDGGAAIVGGVNGFGRLMPLIETADPLSSLQHSFGRLPFNPWIFGEVLVGVGGILIGAALVNGILARRAAVRTTENPDQLFSDLIGRLELTGDEVGLLREITAGARLRHPTMCLLSPGLLDWARATWLAEQGDDAVTAAKRRRVDDLCVKLFDQVTPSAAAAAEKTDASLNVAVSA
jgi:hypothetical protein